MAARLLFIVAALGLCQTLLVAAVAALHRSNIYTTVILVALGTAPAVWFGDVWLAGQTLSTDGRVYLVLLHLAVGGFLFHFMTLPDRSVTLRVLVELDRAPSKTLSIGELAERYSVRDMIVSRLQQMAEGGFIVMDDRGRITIAPRGEAFGKFVTEGRRLFGITSAN